MSLYTSDWNPLGKDIYYRKFELYSMSWINEINLREFSVFASHFGGPIALMRNIDESKKSLVPRETTSILIYSSVGSLMSTIKWTGKLISLICWSKNEDLLCIQDDGLVFVYDVYGSLQNTITLDQEIRDTKVLSCKTYHCIHGTGIAILTVSLRFFVFNNIEEPKIRRLAEVPGLVSAPSSWSVIANNKDTQVLVANNDILYLLNSNEQKCVLINIRFNSAYESITEMAVSFDSTNISLFTDTGLLWIGKTENELRHKFCEFDTTFKKAKPQHPQQFLWCDQQSVVGLWKNVLLVVGLDKDWLTYVIDGPIHLVQEIDGIRIIGNDTHEFLQRVPPVVVDIFCIGSISAGALLLEASKEFQRHSHKADEYIRMIRERNEMETSVKQCIEASAHEYSVSTQKMLLRAASFGKCFVPQMEPKSFVDMCQTIRVLNAIRQYNIGLPISYSQLQVLTMPVLLDRLILRHHYCLAIRIATYLKIPEQNGSARVLGHWACYKVKQTFLDDEQVARDISSKLGYSPGISYAEVANKAIECGRTELAIKLLDHELRSSQQVPLLLKLKQQRLALQRAIESGDTNLIHTVIIRLREVLPYGKFLMIIRDFPIAYKLFQKYCKEEDSEKLRDLFYQEDDFSSEALCWVNQSVNIDNITQKQSCIQSALDSYKKARNDFNASIVEEHLRLIKYQIKLEEKFHRQYLYLSLHQTLHQLIKDKEYKLSEELKKEFKIPDRHFWWVKVSLCAEHGEWYELEKLAKLKKSPIGYEPFVDMSLKFKNRHEAAKYLNRVKEENKLKYYVKTGLLEDAATIAFESRDERALDYVLSKCNAGNRMLAEKINTMKSQMNKK